MCPVSCVTCHVSHVTCHMSCVTCHMSQFLIFFFFFGQIGEAYRWRVRYQRGLPRLVFWPYPMVKMSLSWVLGKRITYWRVLGKLVKSLWGSCWNASHTGVLGETRSISLGVLRNCVTYWGSWGNLPYLSWGIREMRLILGVLGKPVTY